VAAVTSAPEPAQNPYDGSTTLLDQVAALAAWLLEQIDEDEQHVRDPRRPSILGLPRKWHGRVWLPQRIRPECAAKRRVVRTLLAQAERGHAMDAWDTLRIMAKIYAALDRPGYREEWRP
jgi:hypothetical protein